MTKWNKKDTSFILKSLAISGLAILIWSFFYPYQINEDYLDVSLNEKEAKQKALHYISSRGWDISGHTYSCRYDQGIGTRWLNGNYFKETIAQNDKEKIRQISRLIGDHRWNMRWYNPPEEEEIQISYTKDGELTFFFHILPDSLAGDSLPENIAFDIAKMFMKDMTGTKWQEEDWDLKNKEIAQKPNRLDYYFQWENNRYDFDGSTVRMSIRVHGNEVVRYNRWLDSPETLNKQFYNWGSIRGFFNDLGGFLSIIIMVMSILFALFYFKIPTNWKTAGGFAIVIVVVKLTERLLEMPIEIFDFSSEDSLISSISMSGINELLNAMFGGFVLYILMAACEKLYRQTFPNFISIKNLFNPQGYSSKLFFNNYSTGVVAAVCALPITALFYYFINQSGFFIAYQYLDFNQFLTGTPLISILFSGVFDTIDTMLPFAVLVMIIYKLMGSKWISILISALLFSFNNSLDTDPVILSSIYLLILGLISGYLLFKYGILALLVFAFGRGILSNVVLFFFTGQVYYVTTGIILILLILSPLIFCILHYLKFGYTTTPDSLLNSAEEATEIKSIEPVIPPHEPLLASQGKWAYILLIIGAACLFIPDNNELNWNFTVSEAQAIETARESIKNNFNGDVTGLDVATSYSGNFIWQSMDWSMGPFFLTLNKRATDLAYLLDNIGRKGIVDLFEKYNISTNAWRVKFYKPNVDESYQINIDPRNNKSADFYYHHLSDTVTIPSGSQEDAEEIISNTLTAYAIDVSNLPIHSSFKTDHDVRIDHSIDYKREITLDNQFSIEEIIKTTVSGNLFTYLEGKFKIPDDWEREYVAYHPLFLISTWLPLIIWITFIIIGMYFLIRNTFLEKYQISWAYISGAIISVIFICFTYFANNIPLYKAWYWPDISWLAYWLDRRIGNHLEEISLLCFFIIIPVSCAYFINPHIKNLISKSARKTYGKDALISGLATLGAMFLYRPVQYLLYSYFPGYIDFSSGAIDMNWFSAFVPAYSLLLTILIETLWIFSWSIFYYHKYQEYSANGKNIKKYLILAAVSLFYLFYNSFVDFPAAMIPHFLSRLFGLISFIILIKYFWKGNPLSHLFGILIFFHLDRIIAFISAADPTLKPQGWILLIMFTIMFIYSVGIESFRGRFLSKTT